MGFRKSINLGGGIKLNFSKSGVGVSAGVPGFRVSKKAGGGTRTTIGIPGTGISHTSTTGKKRKPASTPSRGGTSTSDMQINTALKQADDCAKLINTTVKPDVFFGRLNFLLGILLDLQKYERQKRFHPLTPTQQYNQILSNLDATVHDFIERSHHQAVQKAEAMKTEKGKLNTLSKYADSLSAAFDTANTFWTGNTGCPHYTGTLYTANNLAQVNALCAEIEQLIAAADAAKAAQQSAAKPRKPAAPAKKPKTRIPLPSQISGAKLLFQSDLVKFEPLNLTEIDYMNTHEDYLLTARENKGRIVLMHEHMMVGNLVDKADMVRDWLHRGDPLMIYLEASNNTVCIAFYGK